MIAPTGLLRQRRRLLHRRARAHRTDRASHEHGQGQRPARPAAASTPPWEEARDFDALPLEAIECLFDSASIALAMRSPVRAALVSTRPPAARGGRGPDRVAFMRTSRSIPRRRRSPRRCATCCRYGAVSARISHVSRSPPALAWTLGPLRQRLPRDVAAARHAAADRRGCVARVAGDLLSRTRVDRRGPDEQLLPSTTHVTLAWGRDYADVSPVRGVILGGGEHSSMSAWTCCGLDARVPLRPLVLIRFHLTPREVRARRKVRRVNRPRRVNTRSSR